jgi:small subunit ribosomal protein S1
VTKVVTFGAFVEILPGVEGLVHISELAQHHVENPREIVQQGETVRVKIIEMDAERRRLSLSLKRVEGAEDRPHLADAPELGLSEEVFAGGEATSGLDSATVPEAYELEAVEPEVAEPEADEPAVLEPEAVELEAAEPEAAPPDAVEAEAAATDAAEGDEPAPGEDGDRA